MTETLGSYVQYIPSHDQEVIAKAMAVKRHQDIHRGMVALLPIDEIIDALRNYSSHCMNYMQQPAYLKNHNNHYIDPAHPEQQFAYCALLVAIGFMKRDQKENEKNIEDDETK